MELEGEREGNSKPASSPRPCVFHGHRPTTSMSMKNGQVLLTQPMPKCSHQGTSIFATPSKSKVSPPLSHPSSHSSQIYPILCPRYVSHTILNSSIKLTMAP